MTVKEDLYFETRKKYDLIDKSNKLGNIIFKRRNEKLTIDQQIAKIDKKIMSFMVKDGMKIEKLKKTE